MRQQQVQITLNGRDQTETVPGVGMSIVDIESDLEYDDETLWEVANLLNGHPSRGVNPPEVASVAKANLTLAEEPA